jgi:undecaprenyl-diphosphatase
VSAADGVGDGSSGAAVWLRQVETNVRATIATLMRPPRGAVAWPTLAQLVTGTLLAVAVVIAAMVVLDASVATHARQLPAVVIVAAQRFTDLGKSGWFLWPIGLVLLALAAFDSPALSRISRGVLAAWGARLGFVFAAIALPGLFTAIVKRLIGRARPFVAGPDIWAYEPLAWSARYASMPSGHATTAFAALVAIGAIFPQARALMWIYAVLIALSRVLITTHYSSDVIAGAAVGAAGAYLVRNWFAARRLGLTVGPDGSVRAMPGPSLRRIIKAVARRPHSA